MKKIILASQSPRRKQLLEWAEIDFTIQVADTDESYPGDLSFEDIAIYIARNKVRAVAVEANYHIPILGADTIVVCNNEVIGKPTSREDAITILGRLAGKTHQVITGVCVSFRGKEQVFSDKTHVTFHPLSLVQMEYYVDKYKPYDKAGAYAIQEWIGVVGIQSIAGDFYNVMGLPVSRVIHLLDTIQ